MTVCIAAICDKGESIVGMTDDRVAFANMDLTMESKIVSLTRPVIALIAGDLDLQSEIIYKVRERIGDYDHLLPYKWKTRAIALAFSNAYSELRQQRIERDILDKRLISLDTWKNHQDTISSATVDIVNAEIDEYELPGVASIIAGVDGEPGTRSAQLYLVEGEKIGLRNSVGFVCIGDGAEQAIPEFLLSGYSPMWSLTRVAQTVLFAKQRAEVISTVGTGTDQVYIIDEASKLVRAGDFANRISEFLVKASEEKAFINQKLNLLQVLRSALYLSKLRRLVEAAADSIPDSKDTNEKS